MTQPQNYSSAPCPSCLAYDFSFGESKTRKNLQLPEKWIGKDLKNHWIHSFIYLDEQGGFFEIEVDYFDKFIKLTKC